MQQRITKYISVDVLITLSLEKSAFFNFGLKLSYWLLQKFLKKEILQTVNGNWLPIFSVFIIFSYIGKLFFLWITLTLYPTFRVGIIGECIGVFCFALKVSWFRNVFLVSSILPKNEQKNSTLLLCYLKSNCFCLFFGRI